MEQTQTDTATQQPGAVESSPLALPSLDDHPQVVAAYQYRLNAEQALAAAKAALLEAKARQQRFEDAKIISLMTGKAVDGVTDQDASAETEAERNYRLAYRAGEIATAQWRETREAVRLELVQRCKALYLQYAADAVEAAERACQLHTQLSRLYSRMSTLCGPLSFPDCHYLQLQEDAPLPAGQYQGWYRVVQQSGLLPKK